MYAKLMFACIALLLVAIAAQDAACQFKLGPVDISGFGKDRPIQASVTDLSSSVCSILSREDGSLVNYRIDVSGTAVFENRSRNPATLFKYPDVLTVRVAASLEDMSSGRFITGYDVDRFAGARIEPVSTKDFEVIRPGGWYASSVEASIPLSPDSKPNPATSKYWVQLGFDARPDELYYGPDRKTRKEYLRKWRALRKQGKLVEFVLAEPFLLNVTLGSNVPACK